MRDAQATGKTFSPQKRIPSLFDTFFWDADPQHQYIIKILLQLKDKV
jgi:hypothetical protein